jgi:hypothetical protein
MGRAGWNHRRRYPVDCVARRPDAAVQVVGDIVCSMGGTPPARRSSGGVSDARVGGRRGVCHVFKPIAGDAAVGPDCDRRVPYCIKPPVHVLQADAAVGQISSRRDTDSYVDSDVAAERRRRVSDECILSGIRSRYSGQGRHGPSIWCAVVSAPETSHSGNLAPCPENACMQRESDADSRLAWCPPLIYVFSV